MIRAGVMDATETGERSSDRDGECRNDGCLIMQLGVDGSPGSPTPSFCSSKLFRESDKLFNFWPTRKKSKSLRFHVGSGGVSQHRLQLQLFDGSQFCTIYLNLNCCSN